jgi:uncharacterized protein YndB with AHSA1/START domain
MDLLIQQSVFLPCPPAAAFQMFTENRHLQNWLTQEADVEPVAGGKYELYWAPADKANDSTIGCKVLAIEPNKLLSFEWKGPRKFKHVMNEVRPLTHVMIFFLPQAEGTEVHLLHTGWRDTPEWEEARQFFEMAWKLSFQSLQKYVQQQEVEKCCE